MNNEEYDHMKGNLWGWGRWGRLSGSL